MSNSSKSPGKIIFNKLKSNPSAIIGGIILSMFLFIAVSGYLLMPDQTPDANNGAIELRKQAPGFTCSVLKIKKNWDIEQHWFLSRMINGQESPYFIRGIDWYQIDSNSLDVTYSLYGSQKALTDKTNIVDCLYALDKNKPLSINGTDATFTLINGKEVTQSKAELFQLWKEESLTQRTYVLGTDNSGRDMLSRLLFGTRVSISIGFLSVLISMSIGLFLGALAGYFRGWVDDVILWFTTVVWSIPGIMLVIAISMAIQSKGIWVAFLAVGLTTWVETARVVRGQVIETREQPYIEAAKALGLSEIRIIFRHILPNIMGPLIVVATSNFSSAILIEAGLSFLGLGVQPPTPSWGLMVHEGYKLMTSDNSWHLVLFPGLCISLLVFAFNIFGNALRDAFDPKVLEKN